MPTKIELKLSGEDGNVYNIIGLARHAAHKGHMPVEKWKKIQEEATSGDYDHVIQTLMKYFEVT